MKNWLGGIFFEKNLPQISTWGIYLENCFLKFLKILKNFMIFSRKIIEKRFLPQSSSRTHFPRIFLDKFLEILENFQEFFSRKIPQVEIWEIFFFSKKMPPRPFLKKILLQNPPQTILKKHPPPDPPPAQTIF